MAKQKIILTGSNGYLGSIILNRLKKKYKIIRYLKNDKVFKSDENNFAILHLAALDKKSCEKNPKLANELNIELTKKIIGLGIKNKYKKIILFSTVHVYGNKKSIINEKTKLKPNNIYGKTKKISEEICNKNSNKIDVVIFRISNVIAKPLNENNQSKNLIINFICKNLVNKNISLNTNGKDVRDFVSINYLLSCVNFFLNSKKVGTYNICSGQVTKIKDIALKIAYLIKKKIKSNRKITFGNVKLEKFDLNFSNKKIKKLVPIKAEHNIFKEIVKILDFYAKGYF